MFAHFYVRRGVVYLPTVALSESGLYIDVDPVDVAPTCDPAAVRAAVERTLARGQPRVADPKAAWPRPVVLKYARARSWAEFERGATTVGLSDSGGRYRIIHYRRGDEGGWDEDPERAEIMPIGARAADVAKRIAEIVCS